MEGRPDAAAEKQLTEIVYAADKYLTQKHGPKLHTLLETCLGAALPLHISLSQTLQLRTEQRFEFLEEITRRLQTEGPSRFAVEIASLDWAANADSTRTFLVARLHFADASLHKLDHTLAICNAVAVQFGQHALYETRCDAYGSEPCAQVDAEPVAMHVSLAWVSGGPSSDEIKASLEHLKPPRLSVPIDAIHVKLGNAIHQISLRG